MRTATSFLALAFLSMAPGARAQMPVEYYHLDAVGTVLAVTNEAGALVEEHDYDVFGQEVGAQAGTQPKRFAGKERDGETGWDYFGARYYGSKVGRFTATDPVMDLKASLVIPQKWNRYAYALNNPLKFVDPDGREEYRILVGDPGRGGHAQGRNFERAAQTRADELTAAGYSVTVRRVSSVADFSAALTDGEDVTQGLIFFGHGGRTWEGNSALFVGDRTDQEAGTATNLSTANVSTLPQRTRLAPGAKVELNACHSALADDVTGQSIAGAVSAHIQRPAAGFTGASIFSPSVPGPNGTRTAAPRGPLYQVPDRRSERVTVGGQ